MLSDFFSMCFNQAVSPFSQAVQFSGSTDHTIPEDLLCTEDEVHFFLSCLDTSKATGPDGIYQPLCSNQLLVALHPQ